MANSIELFDEFFAYARAFHDSNPINWYGHRDAIKLEHLDPHPTYGKKHIPQQVYLDRNNRPDPKKQKLLATINRNLGK